MNRQYKFILIYLVLVRNVVSEVCPKSKQTVTRVPSCPCNEVEWKRRSDIKKCSLVQQQCPEAGKSVYHCVINTFDNETLEVCAPERTIIGHSCVEYNVRGQKVQESEYKKCNRSCPFSYQSTDVYKYQECFRSVERKINDSKKFTTIARGCTEKCTAEKIWQIVALVMIFINIAFSIIILRTMLINRKLRKKAKEENDDNQELLKKPSDNENSHEEQAKEIDSHIEIRRRGSADGESEDTCRTAPDVIRPTKTIDVVKDDGKGIYVAALDIGDQFIAMALAYKTSSGEGVIPVGHTERISTVIEENGKFKLGNEPLLKKISQQDNPATHCKYIYGFKLSDENPNEKHYNGILDAVLYRFKYALDKVEHLKDVDDRLYYAFIVPTYWKEETGIARLRKHILKSFSKDSQFDSERIHIVKREETLSPFIQCVNARVLCLNFNVGNLVLSPEMDDTVYAILHIGSNYCDFTFRLVGKDRIPNLPREDHKWKTLPEEKILDLMSEIFGHNVLKDWKEKHEADYILLVSEFGKRMKCSNGYLNPDEPLEISLPAHLVALAQRKYGQTDIDIKQSINHLKEKISFKEEWKIEIKQRFLVECFQEMKSTVKKMIQKLNKTITDKKVKCVIMTGTYGNMEMIRAEAEKKWFKDRNVTIAIPEDEHVFAMGGAYCVQRHYNKQLEA